MADRIKRFFECLMPVTACNLKCGYCYVIQRDNRKMEVPKLKYTPETIGKGLTIDRLGGVCYFSICGAGETLIPEDTIQITEQLLKNGHFVNITTNGTLSHRFDELVKLPKEHLERLHIAFSLHFNELLRLNMLEAFFDNVRKIKIAGASFVVQINLCDEYLDKWEEIKDICISKIGAPPQVAATRKENDLNTDVELMTSLSKEEYKRIGDQYESPLFEFTMKNFDVKRKEFCYAGDWSGTLNLGTGILTRCYGVEPQDIFENLEKPIRFCAVGRCNQLFCMNSSHFMSLGVIPDLATPSYASLRNRESAGWYTPRMKEFLDGKLINSNSEYSSIQKKHCIARSIMRESIRLLKKTIKRAMNRIGIKV